MKTSEGKMKRKSSERKTKRNKLSQACYIDGREFPSLFALAIDFELNYGWLFCKLKKEGGSCVIKNHLISLKENKTDEQKGGEK